METWNSVPEFDDANAKVYNVDLRKRAKKKVCMQKLK